MIYKIVKIVFRNRSYFKQRGKKVCGRPGHGMPGLTNRYTDENTDQPQGIGGFLISLPGRKAGRQPRVLLNARKHSHMHTERQTVRMTFEFTALGWSKSLPPVFFVLTISHVTHIKHVFFHFVLYLF